MAAAEERDERAGLVPGEGQTPDVIDDDGGSTASCPPPPGTAIGEDCGDAACGAAPNYSATAPNRGACSTLSISASAPSVGSSSR
jgi:hypothetical protein